MTELASKTEKWITDYEEREAQAVAAIKAKIPQRLLSRKVIKGFFADLHQNDIIHPKFLSFSTTDSVGTKVIIANLLNKYNTVGIDMVAMNANDAAVYGYVLYDQFTSYLACQAKPEEEKGGEISEGVVKGLEMCDISDILPYPAINIGKGETCSAEEIQTTVDEESGFELIGSIFGYVEKERVPALNPKAGDFIVGFASSGLHSNGYTAARHVLLNGKFEKRTRYRETYMGDLNVDDNPFANDNRNVGQILLEPTMIYVRPMAELAREFPEVFGVNITGYGLQNFCRAGKKIIYNISDPFEPQPIFKLIQEKAKYSDEVMYTKFNMGTGFGVVVPHKYNVSEIIKISQKNGINAKVIGEVIDGEENNPVAILHKDGEKIEFRKY